MIIEINPRMNVAEAEKLLLQLQSAASNCDILIPTNVEGHQLGGTVALIQVLITWFSRSPQGRLVTYASSREEAQLQLPHLVQKDHGLIAVLESADVLTRNGQTSIKEFAIEAARKRVEAMESGIEKARRGAKVLLVCADHSSKAFLPAFYYQTALPDKEVKGVEDFRILAATLLRHTAEFDSHSTRIPLKSALDIGVILHELFENTHLWARFDCTGKRIRRSIRGIRFEFHNMTGMSMGKASTDSPPLLTFLSQEGSQSPDSRYRFVEISIFDSGPGLAQRILKRCLEPSDSVSTEYDAVVQCLRFRASSSMQPHRGIGLHTVLNVLTKLRGFLRLRTGRLSLFRDFVSDPFPALGEKEPFLWDWLTRSCNVTELPRCNGTVLTMFIPISVRDL